MIRYPLILVVSLAGCFGLQSLALKTVGGKTRKSESNYFSSVARLQTETRDQPEVLFLGSSLTGRLPDRPQVGNLGCDGGSAVITLRALDEGILPGAKVIFVEANTLAYELQGRGKEITAAMRTDWFKVGVKVPNLGATARPSAFIYSWLDAKRNPVGIAPAADAPLYSEAGSGFTVVEQSPALVGPEEHSLVEELSGILDRLTKKGMDLKLVMLPAGGEETEVDLRIAAGVAARTKLPWWNMYEDPVENEIRYTDGRHLDPASAAAVIDALLRKK